MHLQHTLGCFKCKNIQKRNLNGNYYWLMKTIINSAEQITEKVGYVKQVLVDIN